MGKQADIATTKKNDIVKALMSGNYTINEIANRYSVSRRTVQRIRKAGVTQSGRIGKCGTKRKTSQATDRVIHRTVASDCFSTVSKMTATLRNSGIDVSRSTVHRRIKERGFLSVVPQPKPRLTAVMRKRRLEWARRYQHWSVENWRQVCFSDESLFECRNAGGRRVWHQPGTPKPTRPTVKFPTKVMVWSMISTKGTGPLHIVEGIMNAEKYTSVLRDCMILQVREWFANEEWVFMQDGAPCHTANVVKNYLESEGITVLDWPGNSPDMNPIENLWGILKQRLYGQTIKTKNELIREIINAWHRDASIVPTCERLIDSMPQRIAALIEAKGGHTNY